MDTAFDENRIKDLLLRRNILSLQDLENALLLAKEAKVPLLHYLITEKLINRTQLGELLSKFFNTFFIDLATVSISREQVLKIPEDTARRYNVVLYAEDKMTTHVTSSIPDSPKLAAEMQHLFPAKTLGISYSFPEDIEATFAHYGPLESKLMTLLHNPRSQTEDIVDEIFREAVKQQASDVHIEPREKHSQIRFRIDGILHTIADINTELHTMIINRLKILSKLRIDEHKASQDSAIRLNLDGVAIDLRLSIIPTLLGEKTAVRVLAQYIGNLTLSELGLSQSMQKILIESSQKPFGMILVTGPTSSGKTTTLYALLKLLNKPEVNITTIEDPVEYRVDGINQIQIDNLKVTFASGLRSIVRQDPNIVLLGEIRDTETAEIAVNAALTGHLLLSTFHANDAATAIPRLLDMGVEPFLVASTLQLVISQRLVRKICLNCKVSETYTKARLHEALPKLKKYFHEETITLYKGTGCKKCAGTGYRGREGIHEFLKMTSAIQEVVMTHPTSKQIWDIAKREGSMPLFYEGVEKIKAGITTIEEVMRVASPEEELEFK